MDNDLESQIRELIAPRGRGPSRFTRSARRPSPALRGGAARLSTVAAAASPPPGVRRDWPWRFASPGASPAPTAGASPGASSRPAPRSSPSATSSAFLTAATIRQVAAASSSALESSGRSRSATGACRTGPSRARGPTSVTYSGSDWNYEVHQTLPSVPDGDARAVRGQYYLEGGPGEGWLRESGWNTSPQFPEAATLLRLLSPAADFQDARTEVIDGRGLPICTPPGSVSCRAPRPSSGTPT